MPSQIQVGTELVTGGRAASFLDEFCLPLLLSRQNTDGGWGFQLNLATRAEPTAWALLALGRHSTLNHDAATLAEQWLSRGQLPDGSWPAVTGLKSGSWVTALASLALLGRDASAQAVLRGRNWVEKSWPAEGSTLWRLARGLFCRSCHVRQNAQLRGWSWTPGTASWVEPTSYSLIFLQAVPGNLRTPASEDRQHLGKAMLYDRMCPGGGWNSGNPLVYGVGGIPRVSPTVWALLALRRDVGRPEIQQSLGWLERSYPSIKGPGSLALAHLCLKVYGRPVPPLEPRLRALFTKNGFLGNVVVAAWATLALGDIPEWLR